MLDQFITSRFFKGTQRKPRSFSYKPRVYDESKEELEARKRSIERRVKMEKGIEDDSYIPSRKIDFRSATKSGVIDVKKSKKSANIRLIVILLFLIFCFKYAMDWLEKLKIMEF